MCNLSQEASERSDGEDTTRTASHTCYQLDTFTNIIAHDNSPPTRAQYPVDDCAHTLQLPAENQQGMHACMWLIATCIRNTLDWEIFLLEQ